MIASVRASWSGSGEASSTWWPKSSHSLAVFLIDETTSSSIGVESVGRYKAIFNFSGFF